MSCTIIDTKLIEDLSPYTLDESDGDLYINYDNGFNSQFDFKFDKILELQPNYAESYWQPIFIKTENSDILTKKVNRNFTISLDNQIGIEKFLSFKGNFNNWNVQSSRMALDWTLTDSNFSFLPAYGILGWIRTPINNNNSLLPNAVQLYVANGDFMSYHLNTTDKIRKYNDKFFSNSHITANIWKDYQHIYDIITKSVAKDIKTSKHYAAINKLCSILSTHPLRDRITQELFLLDEIKEHTLAFIASDTFNIDSEIKYLNTFNQKVFQNSYFSNIIDDSFQSTYFNGFIDSYSSLFLKLINKYESYLSMSNGFDSIVYKHPLSAPHVCINQTLTNHCGKDLEGSVVYNNVSFNLSNQETGSYRFYTNFSTTDSEYNIGVQGAESNEQSNIPLFDSGKKFDIYDIDKPIAISAGPDIYIPVTAGAGKCGLPEKFNGFDFAPDLNRLTGGIIWPTYQITIDSISALIDTQTQFPFYNIGSLEYKWTIIKGNEGGIKIINDTILEAELEFKAFGRYTLQLEATLDTLSIKDTIDIYLVNRTGCYVGVNGDGDIVFKSEEDIKNSLGEKIGTRIVDSAVAAIAPNEYDVGKQSPVTFNRNRSGQLDLYIDNRYAVPTLIPNDRNICKVPNITEILFSKYGAVQPIKTNSYIAVVSRAITANDDTQSDGSRYIGRLDNANRHNKFFYLPDKNISNNDVTLAINYNTNNTVIKLYRIKLEHLRSPLTPGCKTIYKNTQYQTVRRAFDPDNPRNETVYDRDMPGGSDVFTRYRFDPNTRSRIRVENWILVRHPLLSDYGIAIDAFGGNGGNPFDIHTTGYDAQKIFLPKTYTETVTGHLLDEDDIICHLREAEIFNSVNSNYDYPIYNPNIKFIKGTFHPDLGFITNIDSSKDFYNKTSSLKFNPGNRTTFSFKGPGFYNTIREGIQKSSISISNGAYDVGEKQGGNGATIETMEDVSEPDDIEIHHGYRTIAPMKSSLPRNHLLYDEADGSYGSYDFTLRGRRFSSTGRLQGSNLLFSRIRNIEVKLNFLNQINLKNVRIWIDFNTSRYTTKKLEPPPDAKNPPEFQNDPFFALTDNISNQPIVSNIDFTDQQITKDRGRRKPSDFIKNTLIAEYLLALQEYNTTSRGTYRLMLLNQEHVESNGIDTVLHFSDRFSKHLTPRNSSTNFATNIKQNVNVTNYIKLQPSLALPESEYINTDEYISAIKNNDIFMAVNNFIKFFNQPTVMGAVPNGAPEGTIAKPDSSINITLNIEVLDDYDMVNLDNVSNLVAKTDNNPTINKQIADTIFNALCSWEVIIHTDTDDFVPTDNLGQIKYGWEPHIPGYNFISDDPNISHKLPQAVIDAPNQRLNDLSACFYDENTEQEVSAFSTRSDIRFPSEQLLIGLAALFLGAGGGLIGLSIGFGIAIAAFSAITRFLGSLRTQRIQEQLNQAYVKSVYYDRGYGGPDKILLNVGVNKPFVYDLEAAIYKYSNTPVLKRKVRKYIKANQIKELSRFNITHIKDLKDLFTPYVFEDMSELSLSESRPLGLKINKDLSIKSDILVEWKNELLISSTGVWDKLYNRNIPLHVLTENNLLSLDIDNSINNMILINGSRPYNYFEKGQTVQTDSGSEYIIKGKGKILKNNKEYTVLEFDKGRPSDGSEIFITDELNKNIIIWTDKESDHYNTRTPTTHLPNTLFPKATYGDSTPLVQSSFLSEQLKQNDIPTIYDIFNNQECNVKPTNRIEIYSADTPYSGMIEPRKADPNFAYNLGAYDAPEVLQGITSGPQHKLTAGYSYNLYNILDPKNILRSDYLHIKENEQEDDINFDYLLNNIYNNGPDNPNIIELNNPTFTEIPNSGYIVVEGDYELGYVVSLEGGEKSGSDALGLIMSRLSFMDADTSDEIEFENMTIQQLNDVILSLPEDDIACFSANDYKNINEDTLCKKMKAQNILSNLYNEKNQLLNLLDSIGVLYSDKYEILYSPLDNNIIPHKVINFSYTNNTSPITINETSMSDKYWINIDPEQKCKTSRDSSIKILVKAEYYCWPSTAVATPNLGNVPAIDKDIQNICPTSAVSKKGSEIEFDNAGSVFTYTFTSKEIDRQKERYASKYGSFEWEEMVFPGPFNISKDFDATRSFFVRGKNSRDIYIEVKETYLVPSENSFRQTLGLGPKPEIPDDLYRPDEPSFYDPDEIPEEFQSPYEKLYGEYTGKVKDIIPNDILDSKNLVCRSKVIPRKLRGVDTYYTKHRVDYNGNYVETLPSIGPGGPFTSTMGVWHCVNKDTLEPEYTTDYLKIKNEMIYRSYFGSRDNIEHVDNLVKSLDPFEWIPFEYDPEFEE